MMIQDQSTDVLKPLQISCTSSDCENELHCFKKSQRMSETDRGKCRSCGADIVDWVRVHKCDLVDIGYTVAALKTELVRNRYWTAPIDDKAVNHARRKGKLNFREAVRNRLNRAIGQESPAYDGRQTPSSGNVIYYAQHATACCCRTCMEYWYGIPKGTTLSEAQIEYFVNLVMYYVDTRLPDLCDEGQKIPVLRNGEKRGALSDE
jgi:hypothetical protein